MRTWPAPLRSHDRNRRPRPIPDRQNCCLLLPVTVSAPRRKYKSRKPCTWDLPPYAHPIGCILLTAHCGPCTAGAVMPSDHHHHPRLSQTHHVVMHHHSRPSALLQVVHFQSVHAVATHPMLARCPGLQNLIFALLQLQPTTRMQTRKWPRRPCWKRSRVANRPTSCCAVSHLSIVTWLFRERAQIHLYIGTILDADGTPSGSNTHDHSLDVPIMRGFMSLHRVALTRQ